jgi:hypothetical protein
MFVAAEKKTGHPLVIRFVRGDGQSHLMIRSDIGWHENRGE